MTAIEIISKISGYTALELTDRQTEPLIQPHDCLLAMEAYHQGRVNEGYGSEKLIGRVKKRYKELEGKNWDWRSFYNGWIEGRVEMLNEKS